MEEYNKIYPELLSKEPPKDGNAFRLQQSCRVLENLEKEAKHYASVRKKYKRCYNLLSRTSTLSGTLSFCLSESGVGTAFSGVGLPLAASLGGLGLICGVVSVITGEAGKNVSRKVTKHEKTVSICESKINSLKDRISKALADDRISNEEFENILAEMSKYHELKKDIRVGFKKNKVKKTSGWRRRSRVLSPTGGYRITPRDSCGNTQKTSLRRRPSENRSKLFLFSQKRERSGRSLRFGC